MNFSQLVQNKTASISKEEFKSHFKKRTTNKQTGPKSNTHRPKQHGSWKYPLGKRYIISSKIKQPFFVVHLTFLPRSRLAFGITEWLDQLTKKNFPRRHRNPPKITWTKQLCLNSIIYIPASLPKTAHKKKKHVQTPTKKRLYGLAFPKKSTQFSFQNKGHEMSIIQILRNQWTQSRRDGIGNGSSGKLVATFKGSFRSNVFLFKLQLDSPKRHRIYIWYIYLYGWLTFVVNVGKYTIHGSSG